MKTLRYLLLGFLLAIPAYAQDDFRGIPPGEDVNDLYQRSSASQWVLIGTVVSEQHVQHRVLPNGLDNDSGLLYTVRVEQTLCRQTDFQATAKAASDPQFVYLFTHWHEPIYIGGNLNDWHYTVNHRYLFFLVAPPEQKQWIEDYKLDRSITYYRGKEGRRGAVVLPLPTIDNPTPKMPAILDKMTKFCAAVQPADPAQKIAALSKLAASGDPVLQKEAEEAKQSLQPQQRE